MQVADARDLQALARVTLIAHGDSREFLVAPHLETLHETVNGGWESTHGKPLNREPSVDGLALGHPYFNTWSTNVPNRRTSVPQRGTLHACRVLTWLRTSAIECTAFRARAVVGEDCLHLMRVTLRKHQWTTAGAATTTR